MTDLKRDNIQKKLSNEFIEKGFYGILYSAPRTGKIKMTLNCLSKTDKVIVAYPEVNIKKSWIDDIKKWKFKGVDIKYTTYMSFKKNKDKYDILILDECHLISDNQMLSIAEYIKNFNIKKVIALTGTLAEDTKWKLDNILKLKVLVYYPIEKAIEDGVITDYKIEIRHVPLSTIKNTKVKWSGGEFLTSEKDSFNYISNKIENIFDRNKVKALRLTRMRMIMKSKSKINATKKILNELKDKRVLVFTGLTDVADSLDIESYHSKNNNEKGKNDFLTKKINKLAVVKQLNTGITFPKLDTAVINFFDSNAENMAQKISRITCMEYNNPEKIAHVIIICSTEQIEKIWLTKALSFFDSKKIKHIEI